MSVGFDGFETWRSALDMQSSEDEAFARALQAEEYERSCASTADAKLAEELQAQAYEEAGLSAASAVVSARPLSAVSADEKLAEALQAQEYEEAGLSAASAVVPARSMPAASATQASAYTPACMPVRTSLLSQRHRLQNTSPSTARPSRSSQADIDRALEENNYEALLALDDDNVRIGIDDPDAVSFLTSKALEEECSICLDTMAGSTAVRLLLCHHGFHDECIREHFKTSQVCPVCMSDLRELAAK